MTKSDPYFSSWACVNRLVEMYQKHKKLVIAVDFDDTLFDFHKKGFTYDAVIELLKECQKLEFYIIIFTASANSRHPFIMDYCKSIGITPCQINKNAFPSEFGNEGKIFYNILLDDRAGLGQAYQILKATLEQIKELDVK